MNLPTWLRDFLCKIPGLTTTCLFGNSHWTWQRLCTCGFGAEEGEEEGWHGGVWDLKMEMELQPCPGCIPELSENSHMWQLSYEEECLLSAWRTFREESIEAYGEECPYKYEVTVEINGMKEFLMGSVQGAAFLRSDAEEKLNFQKGKPN